MNIQIKSGKNKRTKKDIQKSTITNSVFFRLFIVVVILGAITLLVIVAQPNKTNLRKTADSIAAAIENCDYTSYSTLIPSEKDETYFNNKLCSGANARLVFNKSSKIIDEDGIKTQIFVYTIEPTPQPTENNPIVGKKPSIAISLSQTNDSEEITAIKPMTLPSPESINFDQL